MGQRSLHAMQKLDIFTKTIFYFTGKRLNVLQYLRFHNLQSKDSCNWKYYMFLLSVKMSQYFMKKFF